MERGLYLKSRKMTSATKRIKLYVTSTTHPDGVVYTNRTTKTERLFFVPGIGANRLSYVNSLKIGLREIINSGSTYTIFINDSSGFNQSTSLYEGSSSCLNLIKIYEQGGAIWRTTQSSTVVPRTPQDLKIEPGESIRLNWYGSGSQWAFLDLEITEA